MEHTGVYHLKLVNYLYENDYKVAVVKFMEAKMTRVKTDKADSYYNSRIWKNVFRWRAL
jgi:transposase